MKVYLVYSDLYCEDEQTCSCHWSAKDLDSIFKDKKQADKRAAELYLGSVEEHEVI